MKTAIAILIIIHGLIHLMGFIKAFSLAEMEALTQSISRSMGILWFLTVSILVTGGVFCFIGIESWWKISVTGMVLSQVLIFYSWKDAKYGTLINVILAVLIFIFH